MTHYEVLGVGRTASPREIRRAFVDRARRAHPDFHTDADARTRAAAESEMRRINEAWNVLGDADRRRAYDADLIDRERRARPAGAPSPAFVPYAEDDTDYAALLDDAGPGNGTPMPRAVQLAPPILVLVAIFCTAAGLAANFTPLVAVGVVCVVLAGLSFLLAPALAVMRSLDDDPDASR